MSELSVDKITGRTGTGGSNSPLQFSGDTVTLDTGVTISSGATIGTGVSLTNATFPSGHILQIKSVHPNSGSITQANGTGSSSGDDNLGWSEFDSNLRIEITPKHASNTLFLESTFLFGAYTSSIITHWRFSTQASGGDVAGGVNLSASESRTSAHGSLREGSGGTNEAMMITIKATIAAGSTSARTYYIQMGNEGTNGSTRYFNGTFGNTHQIAYCKPTFTVMEIQA